MDYRTRVRKALKVRCLHLRTKASYFPLPDPGEEENPADTAIWWCARSLDALGPDDGTAGPDHCDDAGRSCYEPPVAG